MHWRRVKSCRLRLPFSAKHWQSLIFEDGQPKRVKEVYDRLPEEARQQIDKRDM